MLRKNIVERINSTKYSSPVLLCFSEASLQPARRTKFGGFRFLIGRFSGWRFLMTTRPSGVQVDGRVADSKGFSIAVVQTTPSSPDRALQ
jgi:hypothetical protein